jgi:hypothetical protein
VSMLTGSRAKCDTLPRGTCMYSLIFSRYSLPGALHGTLGSYLRDALQEGSDDAVACLPVPRTQVFSSSLLFAWWPPLLFLVRAFCILSRYHIISTNNK